MTFQPPSSTKAAAAPVSTTEAPGEIASAGGPDEIASAGGPDEATIAGRPRDAHHPPAPSIPTLNLSPANEAWPAGTAPLVRWLRAHPDVLGELVGGTLSTAPDEVPGIAGAIFLGADGSRLLAVVELGDSSEAMLGALLTSVAASGANRALWICGEPRAEHRAAISWLNRAVDVRCYLARLRAARIGSSPAAPVLDLVVRPPRTTDRHEAPQPDGSEPDAGRRAQDWREIVLGETAG